jgi:hypothetical protein
MAPANDPSRFAHLGDSVDETRSGVTVARRAGFASAIPGVHEGGSLAGNESSSTASSARSAARERRTGCSSLRGRSMVVRRSVCITMRLLRELFVLSPRTRRLRPQKPQVMRESGARTTAVSAPTAHPRAVWILPGSGAPVPAWHRRHHPRSTTRHPVTLPPPPSPEWVESRRRAIAQRPWRS